MPITKRVGGKLYTLKAKHINAERHYYLLEDDFYSEYLLVAAWQVVYDRPERWPKVVREWAKRNILKHEELL